jgi:hypothetical protein
MPALNTVQGAAIMSAVAVVVLVTAVNNYQKEQQFRALNQINDDVKVGLRVLAYSRHMPAPRTNYERPTGGCAY